MHVFVVPASPKTGQATIRALLHDASRPSVTGVYRDLGKVPAEFRDHPQFTAVEGDVADVGTLRLAGADAVVTITPPLYSDAEPLARAREMAANVKFAVGRTSGSVRRLVYVSSVGAGLEHGTGEIKTNYEAEQALAGVAPEVVFVRCAYFMENWSAALETLKAEPPFFHSVVCPEDFEIPMVSVRDVGQTCAAQALGAGSPLRCNPHVFDLQGPRSYSTRDVQRAFEAATGRRRVEIRMVEHGQLEGFFAQVFREPMASMFAEMTRSFLPGGIMAADAYEGTDVQRGTETLEKIVREMLAG
ncbi:Putative NAD(P)-binding domain, NAD(P)-binding domain superfamily [Colletotrichum destructivum]|uniref:NAD(P)-binding domain, NAD(P)-binding domain superfamily n=1 Tax=Colletotrichum destructivum TaxID=34406 RepID=A0AAX4IGN4_9PEZI|nr:Putative NAD(P)-binding domain, NAD(P)-binding domain superfamily [Colletotrichum destructivum]